MATTMTSDELKEITAWPIGYGRVSKTTLATMERNYTVCTTVDDRKRIEQLKKRLQKSTQRK